MTTWMIFGLVLVLVVTAKQSRRYARLTDRRHCKFCHAVFGAEARFCGRCGRPL